MLDLGWLAAVMRVLCAKSRPNFWLISSVSLVKASCESFPCRGIQSAKGTLVTGSRGVNLMYQHDVAKAQKKNMGAEMNSPILS